VSALEALFKSASLAFGVTVSGGEHGSFVFTVF